jgi:hypothetical protein
MGTRAKRLMDNELDVAWAAGFIDGDGFISIEKTGNVSKAGNQSYTTRVEATQGVIEPLNELVRIFGGHIFIIKNTFGKYFGWRLKGEQLKGVLQALIPHLRVKKRQALLALEFNQTIDRRQSINGVFYGKTTEDVRTKRDSLYNEIKRLNNRKLHAERLSERAPFVAGDDATVRTAANKEAAELAEMTSHSIQ